MNPRGGLVTVAGRFSPDVEVVRPTPSAGWSIPVGGAFSPPGSPVAREVGAFLCFLLRCLLLDFPERRSQKNPCFYRGF